MMRRIVDATIPVGMMIATVPLVWRVVELPMSLERSLGEAAAIVWACVVAFAFLAIAVGVCFRVRRPALSFKLEYPALIFAGFVSAIFATAIFATAGGRGWGAAWTVITIAAHCLARFLELGLARRKSKQAEKKVLEVLTARLTE